MADLTILIPEETFSPNIVRCVATDVSLSGVRLKTYQLNKNDYLSLIKTVHFAKVVIELPYSQEPLNARASIVWVEYHEPKGGEGPYCILGLKFERLSKGGEQLLENAIARLAQDSISLDFGPT